MVRSRCRATLLAFAVVLASGPAAAQFPLVLDGGWARDTFESAPRPVLSQNSMDPTMWDYDFTLTDHALLTITDCCQFGDEYDVFDGATLLESSALLDGEPFGDQLGFLWQVYDPALDNPLYHGIQTVLPPGDYELRIEMSVLGGGFPSEIGLRLDTVQPVPALGTWSASLLGMSLGAAGFTLRRRASS